MFPAAPHNQAENGGGGNRTRVRFTVKRRNGAKNRRCVGCAARADVLCEFADQKYWWHGYLFGLCESCLEKYADGGWVYFIRADGLVKIGHSLEPKKRFQSLATASPVPLTLWHKIPGPKELERELHERFASDRSHGEWFHISAAIRDYVRASAGPARSPREEQVTET